METVFAKCVLNCQMTADVVSFAGINLMLNVCVTTTIKRGTISKILFCLSDLSDWLLCEEEMYKQGFTHRKIFKKLCDYSLTKLVNYFVGQLIAWDA